MPFFPACKAGYIRAVPPFSLCRKESERDLLLVILLVPPSLTALLPNKAGDNVADSAVGFYHSIQLDNQRRVRLREGVRQDDNFLIRYVAFEVFDLACNVTDRRDPFLHRRLGVLLHPGKFTAKCHASTEPCGSVEALKFIPNLLRIGFETCSTQVR